MISLYSFTDILVNEVILSAALFFKYFGRPFNDQTYKCTCYGLFL